MNTTQITARGDEEIPATQNTEWGFFGTMNEHAETAWPLAMLAISNATRQPFHSVQLFLDSRHGRHFADDVGMQLHAGHALPEAIENACGKWMSWTIGRYVKEKYGIPKGLPYLTGFVIHCECNIEVLA